MGLGDFVDGSSAGGLAHRGSPVVMFNASSCGPPLQLRYHIHSLALLPCSRAVQEPLTPRSPGRRAVRTFIATRGCPVLRSL